MPRGAKGEAKSGFSDLIRQARKAKGWTLRELEAETRRISNDENWVTATMVSNWENGHIHYPGLAHLDLTARALDIPLRRIIEVLGFDLSLSRDPVTDRRRQRVQTILGAATEDDIGRIETLLSLDEKERAAVDAYLAATLRR